jgi:perosamine synthetase
MRRYIAPAGAPVPLAQLARAWLGRTREDGLQAIAAYVQAPHVFGACSGRAALWLILKALHRLRPDRNVVAIPAYTCFSVAAAVVRAGLKVHPIDVHPETLELDYGQLESTSGNSLLCVLTANLFGYVNDWSSLEAIARSKSAFLVDDAAQALGASRDGRPAGTAGHVGFFSVARGKPLPAGEGGIIVTWHSEVAAAIKESATELAPSSKGHGRALVLKLLAISALLNPKLYWIPNSLPFLRLGLTEYDPGFPTNTLARFSRALVGELAGGLDALNDSRRKTATAIARAINGDPRFSVPTAAKTCVPTFVRFPLLARDPVIRDKAVGALQRAGIGASAFYPHSICEIDAIGPHMATSEFHCPRAEELSRRILTLPTHPLVGLPDVKRMAAVLRSTS